MAHWINKKQKSKISDKDYDIISTGKKTVLGKDIGTEFGKSSRDYIEMNIFNTNGTLLDSIRLDEPVQYTNVDDNFEINPGIILRKNGYFSGDYEIEFNFLREVAGSSEPVLLNQKNEIYTGEYDVLIDNSVVERESGKPLREMDYKYYIHEVSNGRKEIRLATLPIKNDEYKRQFRALTEQKLVTYANNLNTDVMLFDNPNSNNSNEFTLADDNSIQLNKNMIGGDFVISDAFEIMDLTELSATNDGFAIERRGGPRFGDARINNGDQQQSDNIIFSDTFEDVANDSRGGEERDMYETALEVKKNSGRKLFNGAFIMGYVTARKTGFPFRLNATLPDLLKIKQLNPTLQVTLIGKDIIRGTENVFTSRQTKVGTGTTIIDGVLPLPDNGLRETGLLYDAKFELTFDKGIYSNKRQNKITIYKENLIAVLPDYNRSGVKLANSFIEQGINY